MARPAKAHAALSSLDSLYRVQFWQAPDAPFLPWGAGAEQLAIYMDMLLKWNKVLNLSGCRNAVSLLRNLIQDSFFLAAFLNELPLEENCAIYDLGAGAGLPGIPLRLFWHRGQYTMVDVSQKRTIFLQNVLARLALPGTQVHAGDAVAFLNAHAAQAHAVISRAFMPWPRLLPFCAPALAPRGLLIIMANEAPPDTLPAPWRVLHSLAYMLDEGKNRWLWALGEYLL